jgi:glycosyltransferase involved in cell wall biosynthesis
VENREEAILADSPKMFSQACIDIIIDKTLRDRLTENAFKKYSKYYTWEAQADNIAHAVRHCLGSFHP